MNRRFGFSCGMETLKSLISTKRSSKLTFVNFNLGRQPPPLQRFAVAFVLFFYFPAGHSYICMYTHTYHVYIYMHICLYIHEWITQNTHKSDFCGFLVADSGAPGWVDTISQKSPLYSFCIGMLKKTKIASTPTGWARQYSKSSPIVNVIASWLLRFCTSAPTC